MVLYYTYYSYEQWGRGYIGYRKCPKDKTPETDNYLGSYTCKNYHPTEKIILATYDNKKEAIADEIKLHKFFNVANNPHFANRCNQTSTGFSFYAKGKDSPSYGRKASKKTLKKLSESHQEGFYVTPWGIFISSTKACKHPDSDATDHHTILDRCKNPEKVVYPSSGVNPYYWYKSWRANGFYYIPLDQNVCDISDIDYTNPPSDFYSFEGNPLEELRKFKRMRRQQRTYYTPWGVFISSTEASEHPDSDCGRKGITARCLNPYKMVNPHYLIPSKYWHKTWYDSGFYYEEKNDTCKVKRNSMNKGFYHTPWGVFSSSKEAIQHNESECCLKTLLNRCRKPDRLVKAHSRIPKKYWNRTWRANGFWYESLSES